MLLQQAELRYDKMTYQTWLVKVYWGKAATTFTSINSYKEVT